MPPFPASEAPTRPKNVTASLYQSLLSSFDSMTQEQRMEFGEVMNSYGLLDADSRRSFTELLRVYGSLSRRDRAELKEMAVRWALTSGR